MDHSHLRLFDPDRSESHSSSNKSNERTHYTERNVSYSRVIGEARVAVSVGDLMPILAEAWESRKAWLGDFQQDRVIVSQDLYEVLLAYKRLNKSAA